MSIKRHDLNPQSSTGANCQIGGRYPTQQKRASEPPLRILHTAHQKNVTPIPMKETELSASDFLGKETEIKAVNCGSALLE
jgi:hypothetical protein